MTLKWYYSVDASTVLEITDRVRLPIPEGDAEPIGVGAHAEEGSGWEGQIEVDDRLGDLIMLMHRRIYAVQDAEASGSQVVGNWFISNLDVERMDPWSAASRKWIVSMADENSLLGRRIFVGTDSVRAAETDIVRIRWLLTTTELNTVDRDETFIDTAGGVTLDAGDYTGQTSSAVMEHCKKASGKNYWIKYGEAAAVGGAIVSSSVANPTVITTTSAHGLTSGMSVVIAGHSGSTPTINGTRVVTVTGATTFTIPVNVTVGGTGGTTTTIGRYQLCYFNANTSDLYPSALSLSNVAAEINSSTVFAISDDTRLSRAGGRGPTSGVYEPYVGGYVYEQNTDVGDTYVYRDVAAPSVNVKTAAAATAIAVRELAELDEPDDLVETEIIVQAAQLNDAMHGMSIPLHATHLPNFTEDSSQPGYSDGTNMRIMRRQIRQIGPTTFGNRLWLSPGVGTPVTALGILYYGATGGSDGIGPAIQFVWEHPSDGSGGCVPFVTVGPIVEGPIIVNLSDDTPKTGISGWTINATGTIDIRMFGDVGGVAGTAIHTITLLMNGVSAFTHVFDDVSNPSRAFDFTATLTCPLATANSLTATYQHNQPGGFAGVPAGSGGCGEFLQITGASLIEP